MMAAMAYCHKKCPSSSSIGSDYRDIWDNHELLLVHAETQSIFSFLFVAFKLLLLMVVLMTLPKQHGCSFNNSAGPS